MKTSMRYLLILPTMFIAILAGYSQHVFAETTVKTHKYEEAARSGAVYLQVGYQFNDRWSVGLEYGRSSAEYEIRMPNKKVSGNGTISFFGDPDNHVFKPYERVMNSFRSRINYNVTSNFRVFAGPAIRFNTVKTKPTNETTFNGNLFSDLEFEGYTNYGAVFGFDYIHSFDEVTYITFGMDVQVDSYSSSSLISESEFIGSSVSYGVGLGFRIGAKKKEVETSIDE